jgi:sugar fermentation stimulation protein A
MLYPDPRPGVFLARPNRFVAEVALDGRTERCHVKNTGRCAELLISGAEVFVQPADRAGRSTAYDLVSVWKGDRLINIDSGAPNKAFAAFLASGGYLPGVTLIRPETTFGRSRFDFYVEAGTRRAFVEVKGVTLEENGVVLFPDAPTLRGVKHVNELVRCLDAGYDAHAVFVIQMRGVRYFAPNDRTHPAFGDALRAAARAGVRVAALDCRVDAYDMIIGDPVSVRVE